MDSFETFPEQTEAKRRLRAALADGPAHAYLFHGPPGVGKRAAAQAFAAELLGGSDRALRNSHPDLYVLVPVGDQIRIDEIRELRRDLHMRPFEADRRVYVIHGADTMNEDAADALLKDLEEPPPYAVIVLVATDIGPLPETIRSRCQLVPFRRLSERAIRAELEDRAPELAPSQVTALARVASGRLDRMNQLLEPDAIARRTTLLELGRAVYRDPEFEPADAAERLLEGICAARREGTRGGGGGLAAPRPAAARGRPAAAARTARRRAGGAAPLPRRARSLVPRPRRRGHRSRAGRDPLRPPRRPPRGRDRREARRSRARLRDRPRGLARAGGVQPQCTARPGGTFRPPEARTGAEISFSSPSDTYSEGLSPGRWLSQTQTAGSSKPPEGAASPPPNP